jgi:hypothetical protein
MLDKFKNTLQKLVNKNQDLLSKTEVTFFKRKMHQFHQTPIFYGLPKVHKTPVTLRLVVRGLNSLSAVFYENTATICPVLHKKLYRGNKGSKSFTHT